MEDVEHSQKRALFPYILLVIVMVCTALILSELWANVSPLIPHPWEGPTPTATLWWRTPQVTNSVSPVAGAPQALSKGAPLETQVPGAEPVQELGDG
jgi:hypothetical protein